jgi:hypothetical protein
MTKKIKLRTKVWATRRNGEPFEGRLVGYRMGGRGEWADVSDGRRTLSFRPSQLTPA